MGDYHCCYNEYSSLEKDYALALTSGKVFLNPFNPRYNEAANVHKNYWNLYRIMLEDSEQNTNKLQNANLVDYSSYCPMCTPW